MSDQTKIDPQELRDAAKRIGDIMNDDVMSVFQALDGDGSETTGQFPTGQWLQQRVADRISAIQQQAQILKTAFTDICTGLTTVADDLENTDGDNAAKLKGDITTMEGHIKTDSSQIGQQQGYPSAPNGQQQFYTSNNPNDQYGYGQNSPAGQSYGMREPGLPQYQNNESHGMREPGLPQYQNNESYGGPTPYNEGEFSLEQPTDTQQQQQQGYVRPLDKTISHSPGDQSGYPGSPGEQGYQQNQ